jgi:hypothetical protein
MKNKAIAKLGRENHLNGLLSRLPFLTIIYGVQCTVIHLFAKNLDVSQFATTLGLMLIGLVTGLFIYDKYHHVLLYSDHILVYFEPLNTAKRINYSDIEDIVIPENECEFSSIMLKLKNKDNVTFHFVDFPHEVKQVINDIKNNNTEIEDLAA